MAFEGFKKIGDQCRRCGGLVCTFRSHFLPPCAVPWIPSHVSEQNKTISSWVLTPKTPKREGGRDRSKMGRHRFVELAEGVRRRAYMKIARFAHAFEGYEKVSSCQPQYVSSQCGTWQIFWYDDTPLRASTISECKSASSHLIIISIRLSRDPLGRCALLYSKARYGDHVCAHQRTCSKSQGIAHKTEIRALLCCFFSQRDSEPSLYQV